MPIGDTIGNPALTPEGLTSARGTGVMTREGTVRKYVLLLLLLALSGGFVMTQAMRAFDEAGIDFNRIVSVQVGVDSKGKAVKAMRYEQHDGNGNVIGHGPIPPVDLSRIMPLMWGGLAVGTVVAFIIIFNPGSAPVLAPCYAVAEGFALGGVSAFAELQFGGIVMQAVALTFTIQLVMLGLYRMGALKATGPFVMGLVSIMFGVLLLYVVDIVLAVFAGSHVGIIHDNGPWGIGFSIVICIIAALNFIVDFDTIDEGVKGGAPMEMEWYAAFGMVLTFVWLYLEILRLLIKLRSDSKTIWAFMRHTPDRPASLVTA